MRLQVPSRLASLVVFLLCARGVVLSTEPNLTLGTTSLVFGPGSGTGSVVLGASAAWTAATTAASIHIPAASRRGTRNALVQFTFDTNPGSTRKGSLVFNNGAATLTITQAGHNYVPTSEVTTLLSQVLSSAQLDAEGNLYFADVYAGIIYKWTAGTGSLSRVVSSGLKHPYSIALFRNHVDETFDIYIADTGHNAIKKWTADTGQLTTLVFSLNQPTGVALDGAGNVYIADSGNNAIEKWTASTGRLSRLVSSLNQPTGVAADFDGNLWIADTGNNAIEKWTASTGKLTKLLSINSPGALTLDAAGNLYFISGGVKELVAATGTLITLTGEGFGYIPTGVGADGGGNLSVTWFSGDDGFQGSAVSPPGHPPSWSPSGAIYTSPSLAGDLALDTLGNVYFDSTDLFASGLVRKWSLLTGQITTLVTDVVDRIAGVAVDGIGDVYASEGGRGEPTSKIVKWTASTDQTTLLTFDSLGQFPRGLAVDPSGDVWFVDGATTFPPDASVDGALKKWTAATGQLTTVVPGLANPARVKLDAAGNIYFSDALPPDGAIQKWTPSDGTVSTLVAGPHVLKGAALDTGVAVDGSGNVYFSSGGAIQERSAATGQLSILATPILSPDGSFSRDAPIGSSSLAVDTLDNLYTITYGDIKKLTRAFIGRATVIEPLAPGSDQLLPTLPAGTPLDAVSDAPWLTITSQDHGVVHFSFTATTVQRTAHISVLGLTIPVTQANTSVPTVVSYSVQWGSQSYTVTGSTRARLPWEISGIRVVFSKPVATGDANSLGGVTATGLTGLGTNTLTWTIDPVSLGNLTLALANNGPNALMDAEGHPVTGQISQRIKVLLGDVNGDGVVNASDLAQVTSEKQYSYSIFADMNGDGIVNALDVEIVRSQIGSSLP